MKRIALLLMLLVMGSPFLHAQGYSAAIDAISARFESMVSQMSAAQQSRAAESITQARENIRIVRSRATALEDLLTKIASAKNRRDTARQEWEAAKANSDRARAAVETRMGNLERAAAQLAREVGDFNESWGFPRSGGHQEFEPERKAQFDAAKAPYERRLREQEVREREIARDERHVEALESFTVKKLEAIDRADAEVFRLESIQKTQGVEFEQALARRESGMASLTQFAGLTSFPSNSAKLDAATLIRKPSGANTNALEQLRGFAEHEGSSADFTNDCYHSGCSPSSRSDDGGPAAPAGVPQKVESHPAYQKATQAVAEAERRSQEAEASLRAAQRAGRPAEEQQRLTSDASRLKSIAVMEGFKLKSQVNEMSFGIDVSSRAPKAAGSSQ